MRAVLDEVAPGVHRLGSPYVSFYLVAEAGRYTLVDAGLPRMLPQLLEALAALGADLHDLDAVVVTHAHPERLGLAERLRTEAQATVHVHDADAQIARSTATAQTEAGLLPHLWRPPAVRYLSHLARQGGRRVPRVEDVRTFADGATLDVPGRLRVVGTPGHTHGHAALALADRGVLFAGDALCGFDPLTGRPGPRVPPPALNAVTAQAHASLDRLARVDAETVLLGCGEPWRGTPAAAVERARELAEPPAPPAA